MFIKKILLLLFISSFSQIVFCQDFPDNLDPNKCYAQAHIVKKYQYAKVILPLSTNPLIDSNCIDSIYFLKRNKDEKLEYLGFKDDIPQKDSLNFDSLLKVTLVLDTINCKEFEYTNFEFWEKKRKVVKEWREVICGKDIDPTMISDLCFFLVEKGYLKQHSTTFGEKEKKALSIFQNKNNLPIGQLDIETLKFIGLLN